MSARLIRRPANRTSPRLEGRLQATGRHPIRVGAAGSAGLLACLAILASAATAHAQPAWLGGETTVGEPAVIGSNAVPASVPHALGAPGVDGADLLVAWLGDYGGWAQRFGSDGLATPYAFAGTQQVSGLELARTAGGATVATWVELQGQLRGQRLLADGASVRGFALPDDSVSLSAAAAATLASLPDGDLLVARNRRINGDPEYPYPAIWTETVVLRRHGRFGHPRGPSIALSQPLPSCAVFTSCSRQSWGAPRIALGTESALVVWQHSYSNGLPDLGSGSYDVYARLLDADGAPLGETLVLNQRVDAGMSDPTVAALPDGGFVVVWVSAPNFDAFGDRTTAQDGDQGGIVLRRFDAGGSPLGPERIVNRTTAGDQRQPALAVAGDGSFLVAWRHGTSEVRAQRFDANGEPRDDELLINTAGPEVARPSVAAAAGGDFLVAWQRLRYDAENRPRYSLASQRLRFPPTPSPLVVDAPPILLTREDGTSVTFTVSLASRPTGQVSVPIEPSVPRNPTPGATPAEVVVDPATLAFTTDDWDQPHTASVSGLDDGVVDGDQPLALFIGPLVSEDPTFDGVIPGDLRVRNDELGCRLQIFVGGPPTVGRSARFRFGAAGDGCGTLVSVSLELGDERHALGERTIAPDDSGTTLVTAGVPVDATPAEGWRWRVETLAEPRFSGLSDRFRLLAQQCRLDLRAPDGGERWQRGTPRAIRWRTFGNGCGPLVQLELLRAGEVASSLGVTDNDGTFVWQLPADIARGTTYRVRIRSVLRQEVSDRSRRVFTIAGR